MTWPSHPAADLFPMLSASELQALADDIRANGQREPAVVFDDQVIDGRNRIAACALAGVEPRVRTVSSCPDPVAYVLSLNLHRRHLDESQRGIVAAKARVLLAEQAKVRMLAGTKAGDPTPNLGEGATKGESADQAAVMLNVGRGTVEAASKVLKHGVPELVEAVERGQVAVSAAAAVATLPAEEQREAVAGGKEAVREKAKAVRAAKAKPAVHPVLAEIEQATDMDALDRAFNKVAGAGLGEADAEAAGEAYRSRKATLRAPAPATPAPPPAPSQETAAASTAVETVTVSRAEWDALQAEVAGLRQWQESVARRAGAGDPAAVLRVMGLIALTRNPNEHEAASAALNACRMMRERGLTVATSMQPSAPPEVSVELLEKLRKEEADFWAGMHSRFDDVLGRRSS